MSDAEKVAELLTALEAVLFANALFTKPDHEHDPDTEWERAMDMAETAIARTKGEHHA